MALKARLTAFSATLVLSISGVAAAVRVGSTATVAMHRERHPQRAWVACNRNARRLAPSTFRPLPDRVAASLVTPEAETRPDNSRPYTLDGRRYRAPNDYAPSASQVRAFREARTAAGQTNIEFNPYYEYVDGDDDMRDPSTDDLIQWAAHKWGIPENWLRAQYVRESYWSQYQLGDSTLVPATWYRRYPRQSRIAHSRNVYQSLGITQVRWTPDGSLHPGTEPLRWLSTAFNVDYEAATIRFYYDNPQKTRSAWNDSSYRACQAWESIGAWFRPYPWGNPDQRAYGVAVRQILAQRTWTSASFQDWSPSSLPPGIRVR